MYKRGDWSCFKCYKWFGRKDVLRQHLVLHYKKQLGKQFVSKENSEICGLCEFEAKDPKALIQHIALGAHQKLKELLPEQLKDLIFTFKAKEEPAEIPNGEFIILNVLLAFLSFPIHYFSFSFQNSQSFHFHDSTDQIISISFLFIHFAFFYVLQTSQWHGNVAFARNPLNLVSP